MGSRGSKNINISMDMWSDGAPQVQTYQYYIGCVVKWTSRGGESGQYLMRRVVKQGSWGANMLIFSIHRAKRRSGRVRMLIFRYTCSKSDLRRVKMLIFHYT